MLFLATGGTIDKLPSLLPDGSFNNDSKIFGETHLPEMLAKAHVLGEHSIRTLFMVDSLDMTDMHRQQITDAGAEAAERSIIVTHGTDTMPDTARFLHGQRHKLGGKTIVLTGAMVPYSMGEESDALFNVGYSAGVVELLPPGIYVAMNGQTFEATNVYKDVAAGVFKTIR